MPLFVCLRFLERNPHFPKDKKDGTLRPMTVTRLLKKPVYAGYVEADRCPPMGYVVKDRKLVESPSDAVHVRWVFARFVEIGSGTVLARELAERGVSTSRGHRIDKKFIYRMLNNRVYIGEGLNVRLRLDGLAGLAREMAPDVGAAA